MKLTPPDHHRVQTEASAPAMDAANPYWDFSVDSDAGQVSTYLHRPNLSEKGSVFGEIRVMQIF